MSNGHDEICAADLANVCEGRGLAREEAGWLARAITGAIRPNRDKPFWDLAHLAAALGAGRDGRGLIDLFLDPQLARPDALAQRLPGLCTATRFDGHGLLPTGEGGWRQGWSGMSRLLALAEFLLTMEDLAWFQELGGWFDELLAEPVPSAEATGLLVTRLTRCANLYRQNHVPLAPVEKRFRSILSFMAPRRPDGGFDDGDILAFWQAEIESNERPLFRTVAEHFVTYEKVQTMLGGLRNVHQAASLETIEGWADRLDSMLSDLATGDDAPMSLVEFLGRLPETPKILTGVERDDLADLLLLDPFQRSRPLTVLRAASFGRVQSGIGNRLRRGNGGPSIAERSTCNEAESYAELLGRGEVLQAHVERMIRIAAALRLADHDIQNETLAALVKAAEADIKKVRRAGFDDRDLLARVLSSVDERLASILDEIRRFRAVAEKPQKGQPIRDRFEEDRKIFSAALMMAYLGKEAANDDDDQRQNA